jgi:hypothetical protein
VSVYDACIVAGLAAASSEDPAIASLTYRRPHIHTALAAVEGCACSLAAAEVLCCASSHR